MKVFGCTYFTARLYYTATYVPDNRATRKVDASDDSSQRRRSACAFASGPSPG